jgi:hypothetical protein
VGGPGGVGEGPTFNFNRVQNMTNNMYVGDVPRSFSQSLFSTMVSSAGSLIVHSDKLELLNFYVLNMFQAELCLDSKKIWASGWGLLLIHRTDSTSSKASITKPLGAGSYVIADSSDGRAHLAFYGSKESVSQF